MKTAPGAGISSRCLARAEYSIDQPERSLELSVAERDLAARGRVDGGVDPPPQLAQLGGAEHELADGRAAAAEDEVVGARAGELQLRLLDREQALDRFRQRPVAVLGRGAQLAQL